MLDSENEKNLPNPLAESFESAPFCKSQLSGNLGRPGGTLIRQLVALVSALSLSLSVLLDTLLEGSIGISRVLALPTSRSLIRRHHKASPRLKCGRNCCKKRTISARQSSSNCLKFAKMTSDASESTSFSQDPSFK
uniref:Uncharacterized protein n=1 Tax=Opuntia streptacantha TaxID=393608 RepID=A0A7C8ZAU9_OPUST